MSQKRRFPAFFLFFLALVAAALYYHRVDNSLTEEDREAIGRILREGKVEPISGPGSYEREIRYILDVQRAVLGAAPGNAGIPFDGKREPRDLLAAKSGLCYDRSRTIEKILRHSGFETRHIAVYSTETTRSPFRSLISRGVSSHSITEARTSRGWLVVDSNDPWVSLDRGGDPVPICGIRADVGRGEIPWGRPFPSDIYGKPFTYVYGVYSRHGRFYPPFNPVPDVNYRELLHNFR